MKTLTPTTKNVEKSGRRIEKGVGFRIVVLTPPRVTTRLGPTPRLIVGALLDRFRDVLHAVLDAEAVGDDLRDPLGVPAFV